MKQDALGTYKYTVHLKDSLRTEERHPDGTVFGEYTIPDANGLPITIKYRADKDGFRILDGLERLTPTETVLPVKDNRHNLQVPSTVVNSNFARSPFRAALAAVESQTQFIPLDYTPEVKAAREHFFALYRAAAARIAP